MIRFPVTFAALAVLASSLRAHECRRVGAVQHPKRAGPRNRRDRSNGALVAPINFNIPTATPATYKVFVVDDRSQYPVNVNLTVQ